MEENVIVKSEKRPSGIATFIGCMLAILGLGTTIAYCSGIFGGVQHLVRAPYIVPDALVIALPPILFFHQALALFLTLRQNIYTYNGRMVRGWTWVFQISLFLMLAFLPYFVFSGMVVGGYIVATITSAVALGAMILTYRQTIGGGLLMTILFAVTVTIMVYLGAWAFIY